MGRREAIKNRAAYFACAYYSCEFQRYLKWVACTFSKHELTDFEGRKDCIELPRRNNWIRTENDYQERPIPSIQQRNDEAQSADHNPTTNEIFINKSCDWVHEIQHLHQLPLRVLFMNNETS